jgi:hypothetical protein
LIFRENKIDSVDDEVMSGDPLAMVWLARGLLMAYFWLTRGLALASSGLTLASSGLFWLGGKFT